MKLKLDERDDSGEDNAMQVDSNSSQDVRNRLRGHKLSLTCVCIDSKSEHAFTGSKDGSIIKWNLNTRKILKKVNPKKKEEAEKDKEKKFHIKHINCIAISSDDKFLATGGWDKHIRIWSPDDLTWLHTFTMHRQEVTALVFRMGFPILYSGSADRSVMLWNLEDDDNRCFIEALYGHESTITSIDALRRERVLTSGGRDQSLRIWKIVEQAQTVFQTKHESADIVRFIDDKTFVSGGEDGTITIWTTMKRSPLIVQTNAHGANRETDISTKDPSQPGLKFWVNSLAVFSLSLSKSTKPTKRRKLDDDLDKIETGCDEDEDDEFGDQGEEEEDEEQGDDAGSDNSLALIASGSCDSKLNIWHLTKNSGKHKLRLHQTHECPGFINDLYFTNDGKKIVAACGQEHRFGRWWKLSGASKNSIRVFDVKKL